MPREAKKTEYTVTVRRKEKTKEEAEIHERNCARVLIEAKMKAAEAIKAKAAQSINVVSK
ncbi:hypothetical protein [Anaerotignum sp.]|uniref:hypothetical protein n=1 Tax=Anaerotignum sp. TaxID=2039241 RepID=UPI00289CCE3B|nr:hypothetical protein [Anaerotignum sp.]